MSAQFLEIRAALRRTPMISSFSGSLSGLFQIFLHETINRERICVPQKITRLRILKSHPYKPAAPELVDLINRHAIASGFVP